MTAVQMVWLRPWNWRENLRKYWSSYCGDLKRVRLPAVWAKVWIIRKMQEQKGDSKIVPFSFLNDGLEKDQISCWLTYTNEDTHTVIRNNFHRSALFGGQIEGVGPRYCPSIEDKVNRFADKKRHQLFIEPEGLIYR